MAVDVRFAQDTLRGDNVTEIRMKFIKRIEENLPAGDEWDWETFDSNFLCWFGNQKRLFWSRRPTNPQTL